MCWAGYYRKRSLSDLPEHLAAPALRALLNAKITRLAQLSRFTEKEVLQLHGMGPNAMGVLRGALKPRGLSFRRVLPRSM
jgi:hypothetical protein